MRRFSHNRDWGFAPVLTPDKLYPKQLPTRLTYYPTDIKDWLKGKSLDVVLGAQKVTVIERGWSGFAKTEAIKTRFDISSYIGIGVHYAPMPQLLPPIGSGSAGLLRDRIKQMVAHWSLRVPGEDGVTLYLVSENSSQDLLLYYAPHEDEIIAQWHFWSQRLGLPRLLIAPDGFIDEPSDHMGKIALRPSFARYKSFGLYGRRPIFSRIRDMGDKASVRAWRGREITARH